MAALLEEAVLMVVLPVEEVHLVVALLTEVVPVEEVALTVVLPVEVLTAIRPDAEAQDLTFPVLLDTSMLSNEKPAGISISPVCPLITSVAYSDFGR